MLLRSSSQQFEKVQSEQKPCHNAATTTKISSAAAAAQGLSERTTIAAQRSRQDTLRSKLTKSHAGFVSTNHQSQSKLFQD